MDSLIKENIELKNTVQLLNETIKKLDDDNYTLMRRLIELRGGYGVLPQSDSESECLGGG